MCAARGRSSRARRRRRCPRPSGGTRCGAFWPKADSARSTSATTRSWIDRWPSRCRGAVRRRSRSRSSCRKPAAWPNCGTRASSRSTTSAWPSGQCYIVSDFLQGITLQRWLAEHTPTWQEAARITADVADALAHAHAHRTVHRDVKPENIILIEGLKPVLVDFGLGISESDQLGVRARPGRRDAALHVAGAGPGARPSHRRPHGHLFAGRHSVPVAAAGGCRSVVRDRNELWRQIMEDEPQPPRQLVPSLPRQLERSA